MNILCEFQSVHLSPVALHERYTYKVIPSNLHCVSKNVSPLTCCNLDKDDQITTIFGRSVTAKVRNQMMLCFPTSPI